MKEGFKKKQKETSTLYPPNGLKYKRKYGALNQSLFSEHNTRQQGCTITRVSLGRLEVLYVAQGYIQGKRIFQVLYHYFGVFFQSSVLRTFYFCLFTNTQRSALDFTLTVQTASQFEWFQIVAVMQGQPDNVPMGQT